MKKCHWTFPIYKVHCTLRSLPVYAWPLSLPAIFCSWCFVIGEKSGRERAWYEPFLCFLLFLLHSDPGFTHPRVQFGWQSWQTELASAYFQTRVSFSPSTPAGQVFTQWGPSIKWAHFMQWSGPWRETKKQLVCDAFILVYSEGNAKDKSTCIRRQQVFSIWWFYYLAT